MGISRYTAARWGLFLFSISFFPLQIHAGNNIPPWKISLSSENSFCNLSLFIALPPLSFAPVFIPGLWGNLLFPHSPKMNLFHTPYRQGFPCQHDFFIFSPRCEREHVGPARLAAWHPAAPFLATACPRRYPGCSVFMQRYHYHSAFRLPATNSLCLGAAHTFPSSSTIPCLIRFFSALPAATADKCIFAQLMTLHHTK